MSTRLLHRLAGAALLSCAAITSSSRADTGVSDERVTLPDGPGSIGGIGENAQLDANMGSLSLRVPFRVPEGFQGLTPSLGLAYDSATGAGIVGIGWSMEVPSIERMTSFGLPSYGVDDKFVANEGSQLVRVEGSAERAVYRARFEGEFVRYTWRAIGDGKGGYWTAELPDGRTRYYGADRTGKPVPSARVEGPNGETFRYLLVETVDRWNHRLHHAYTRVDGHPLLDSVDYVHADSGAARFSMRFEYEARPDAISNARPGFELTLTRRLSGVRIFSNAEQIRSYQLRYEPESSSGGMSRLRDVTETGRGGAVYPVKPSFSYSQALSGACSGDCQKPFVVDMGTLEGGVDLKAGRATLIDLNGDSLPDMLDTSTGKHRIFLSQPSTDGRPRFSKPKDSTAKTSAFVLGNPSVQSLDVNGDGLTDMISARTGEVLCNDGSGDWRGQSCLGSALVDFDLEDDPSETGESDPLHVRFFDYDNDKRIDLLRTGNQSSTDVRRDTPKGFEAITVDAIGAVFDEGRLQLADMNGDGLQDPVELQSGGQLRYRIHLGFGKWSDWRSLSVAGFDEAAFSAAELQDINGDGLDDLVVVAADTLQYALNRNAARFDAPVSVRARDVDGALPETTAGTTVLYADMNGNGSNDVVWVSSNGNVKFLDLFPVKPNLLSRIDNGLGMVQRVAYGTALAEQARDGSWQRHVRYGMNVVKRIDTYVTLTGKDDGSGLHDVTELSYHEGFYDGAEKQFRGFERVEQKQLADAQDSQQPGLSELQYDVGADDPYRAGLLLRRDQYALDGADKRPLLGTRTRYEDCALAGVPKSVSPAVRWQCPVESWELKQEGADEKRWASLKTTREHDGYGNVIRESDLGVFNMGSPESPGPCRACERADDAACGDKCEGDETYTETEYVEPGDAWLLRLPKRSVVYGASDGPRRETLSFYDGPEFAGLAVGKASAGALTRVMSRVREQEFVASVRHKLDKHGNVVVALDPLGASDDASGHRRQYEYDAYGLNVTASEAFTKDQDGPYSLRREYAYEAQFNQVSESTAWMVMRGGEAQSSRDSTRYRYDEHGRVARIYEPGDADNPSQEIGYELGAPVSRVRTLLRASSEGQADAEVFQCLDGRGRLTQRISKMSDGRYLVDGFNELNSRGKVVRAFQSYEQSSADCAKEPPKDVAFSLRRYDALGRPLGLVHPDADAHGGKASEQRVEYGPLEVRELDEEDTGSGAAQGTPLVKRYDGGERLIAIERQLGGDKAPIITRLAYDSLDNLKGYTDALGHTRTQQYDLLGRVTRVEDPNAGVTELEYDAANNLVRSQDASGRVIRYSYDGLNRPLETWSDKDRDATLVSRRYDEVPDCSDCSAAAGLLGEVRYPVVLGERRSQGIDRYGYDARRRLRYRARQLQGQLFELGYAYDALDRVTQTMFPDGRSLTRTFDGASRLTSIDGVLDAVDYDAQGLLAARTFANGVKASYTYDARERLSRLGLRDGRGGVIFELDLRRDRVGNLLGAEPRQPRDGALGRAMKLEYDALYRLTSATLGTERVSLGYDTIDNLTSRTSDREHSPAQVGEYTYDDKHPNAVSKLAGLTYAYDASGSLVSRGKLRLTRDHLDRVSAARSGEDVLGTFAYGADAERVLKDEAGHVTYYVDPEFEVRDGVAVIYPREDRTRLARLEDPAYAAKLLPDADKSGAIDVADAWLAQREPKRDAAVVLQLLAASAHRRLLGGKAQVTFLHEDANENLVAASGADGSLLAERTFHVHGEEQSRSGFVDDHGFSGQELDASTGLIHYAARDLDGRAGRFTSVDPQYAVVTPEALLDVGESTVGYAFVANNPVNLVDPSGLMVSKKRTGSLSHNTRTSHAEARPRSASAGAPTRADASRTITLPPSLDTPRAMPALPAAPRGWQTASAAPGAAGPLQLGAARSAPAAGFGARPSTAARATQLQLGSSRATSARADVKRGVLEKIGHAVFPWHERSGKSDKPQGKKVLAAAALSVLTIAGGIAGGLLTLNDDAPDAAPTPSIVF